MSPSIATDSPLRVSLRIHPDDNLGVALADLPAGREVEIDGHTLTLANNVRHKHKFALEALSAGDSVTMYGVVVGKATQPIPSGGLIGTHNVEHATGNADTRPGSHSWTPPNVDRFQEATFQGYHRPDGRVGTANVWLVIPLVFCENRNIDVLRQCVADALGDDPYRDYKRMARQMLNGDDATPDEAPPTTPRPFPNVDGVRFLTHTLGCGGTDDDAQALCRLLAGYICHPNVAGATVLSLGCQKAQIQMLKQAVAERDPQGLKTLDVFDQQSSPSEEALIRNALTSIFDGLAAADRVTRQPAPLSQLVLGVECGGSDGFSGISANPLVGSAVDRLVALGGSGLLSEFPELCGVEHELIARCRDERTAARFRDLMYAYQRHAAAVGADFAMNPSPGNIRDGLITDAMKSAGAAKKGGDSPVVDVLDYTEPHRHAGLSLLCTPGNDVESTTALAGSGANLILFTTGLGTPTGNPIAPVLKIASNSDLAQRMHDVIDFDAGPIVRGEAEIGELADALLTLCIDTASGRYQSRAQRLSQHDFIPWKRGVSL
ncbi:UxaA family hydrolase [Halomonas sp. IOP_31]|uniref:UxaA family hydrolase n=1 Tax=Halomonas sp. IOP_31 TaxID=2876584 RepID=UPI001E473723|nr:altronate dehydratase family protein [Halomonas sp. IOP_31]MCD6009972.1 altronate dehydratase family protein [Halomonas sp. IOP_31]